MVRQTCAFAAVCGLVATLGCGKKGPPLSPFVRIPAAVDEISARRVGSDVYVTLTVPGLNIDDSAPAAVDRVAVYGYTGRVAPVQARWVELGTLVATVQVESQVEGETPAESAPASGVTPGGPVTIRDALGADELVQGPVDAPAVGGPPLGESDVALAPQPLRRFYLAIAFNAQGRPGPPGTAADLSLEPLPAPPVGVVARFTEQEILVDWELSRGLPGPQPNVGNPALGAPVGAGTITPLESLISTTYNVYRSFDVTGATTPTPDAADRNDEPPAPLNAEALALATFSEPVEFGGERCYHVRTVRVDGPTVVESEASMSACVTPVDIFPPAPPTLPAAVAADGAITLIWEANSEPDVAGYLVLRGEAGDDTLRPLTPLPIVGTNFRDVSVAAGTRYVYAVVAVDNRSPVGNASMPSERVEETAR